MEERLWVPPYDAALGATAHGWALAVFAALALGAFAFALVKAWRDRDWLPVILFLASLAMTTIEPYVDAMGLCWYPEVGTTPGYRNVGRTIPLYIILVFCFYVAPAMIIVVDRCKKGITAGWLLKFYLVTVVLASLFEPIPLYYGLWSYYGHQPFVFLGFPVWFAFVNTVCVLLTAIGLYLALPYLRGWKRLLLIPLAPVFGIGAWSACGFFVSSTLNRFHGEAVTSVGAVATMLSCIGVLWLAGTIAAERKWRP